MSVANIVLQIGDVKKCNGERRRAEMAGPHDRDYTGSKRNWNARIDCGFEKTTPLKTLTCMKVTEDRGILRDSINAY